MQQHQAQAPVGSAQHNPNNHSSRQFIFWPSPASVRRLKWHGRDAHDTLARPGRAASAKVIEQPVGTLLAAAGLEHARPRETWPILALRLAISACCMG